MALVRTAVPAEIDQVEAALAAWRVGDLADDAFKRFRVHNGIYSVRAGAGYMLRVRSSVGRLSPSQLLVLARLVATTPGGRVHLTTRQDVELHGLTEEQLVPTLRRLAAVGLSTRETGGNVVRSVTCCPLAGVAVGEPFDVTPYAEAVASHFLRHPAAQNLPRKLKVAFEGCLEDHARTIVHDIGLVATMADGRRGFRIWLGGGLGVAPRAGVQLEPFTRAELLLATCEAVVRVFDRHGNRGDRQRARLKFLVQDWGVDGFRAAVLAERQELLAGAPAGDPSPVCITEEQPPRVPDWPAVEPQPGFWDWRRRDVLPQRQVGWHAVRVRCPLGDLDAAQLTALATAAARYCGGRLRLTNTQKVLLRWVPEAALGSLHRDLTLAGLVRAAEHAADVTRCPGADYCNLAITRSAGLAAALDDLFVTWPLPDHLAGLTVKISGCPDSCGHHLLADLGFHGASRRIAGREVPHYMVLVGGETAPGVARFARPILMVPARAVPAAVRALLEHYLHHRRMDESLAGFVERGGVVELRAVLAPFQVVPAPEEAPEFYRDLGPTEEAFAVRRGPGECAT